jgi:hypothetical protein
MKIKKIFSALIAVLLLCSFTACGDNNAEGGISPENGLPPQVTEFTVITPPEAGWTLDSINEVLYINRQKLSFPFRFGDLGEDFTIPELVSDDKSERLGGNVYYKDKPVFGITGKFTDDARTLEESLIDSIMVIDEMNQTDLKNTDLFVLNGLTIGSDISEIKEKLGTVSLANDISTEYTYIYAVGGSNNAFMIGVDENTKKVNEIWIVLSFEVNAEKDKINTETAVQSTETALSE